MSRPACQFITLLAAVSVLLVGASSSGQETEQDFAIEYSGAPDAVILEYDVESAAQMTPDTGEPLLRVYGNGRVVVYRPGPDDPSVGHFETQLADTEVAQLLTRLYENGAITYDAKAVHDKLNDARAARANSARGGPAVFEARSDVDLSIFRIQLESYRESATTATQTDVRKDIRCVDLQHESERHLQITELHGMAIVENELQALANDARLRKVGGRQ